MPRLFTLAAALLSLLPACARQQGAEGGACYPNRTCNERLTCLSDLCVAVAEGEGEGEGEGEDGVQRTLTGSAIKGPMLTGSSISGSPLDGEGNATGLVFSTQIEDDLGSFSLVLPAGGFVSLEANGFYYNEVTGALSTAPIALRGIAEVGAPGGEAAFVNVLTHLTHDRTLALVLASGSLAAAAEQAQREVFSSMPLPAPDTTDSLTGFTILSGDSATSSYLFAVSTLIAQVAVERSGSVDANVQELLNSLGDDLKNSGAFSTARVEELRQAQSRVDVSGVEGAFAVRLLQTGSTADVPDLDSVLDSDLDGIANIADNCPSIVNPGQDDRNGNGAGDACDPCQSDNECGTEQFCGQGECRSLACSNDADCGYDGVPFPGKRYCDEFTQQCVVTCDPRLLIDDGCGADRFCAMTTGAVGSAGECLSLACTDDTQCGVITGFHYCDEDIGDCSRWCDPSAEPSLCGSGRICRAVDHRANFISGVIGECVTASP